ncbi:restriction endonuclease subunit S [Candidatus Laterigemmans baculatus]|uniref:restriction endonuclease subunit S n=1 Tax=Candidatus Laterigemmans baculatus TaxID=2770505 RepID=UPI0013DB0D85|nr:restriction endonuclease subunit S [Candidatus Laterigemmans baculatus]
MPEGENAPAGWERTKLGDVLSLIRNGTTATQVGETTAFPVTRIETIASGTIDWSRVGHLAKPVSQYKMEPGDILYSHINSISHMGKVAIYEGGDALFHGMNLMLLRPLPERANPWFLHAVLAADHGRAYARRECKSAINQASLSQRDIVRFPLNLPPLPEQRLIAEILDTVDEAIRKTEQIIAKLEQVKQGLLHDLLTRGIDDNGQLRDPDRHPEQFKDSELGRIPKVWEVKELEHLVDRLRPIVYGILMPGLEFPGGVPVVKVKDIKGGAINLNELLLTSPAIDLEYRRSRLAPGDLLFTIRGTVGRMAFVPSQLDQANITQDTARVALVRCNPLFVREYLNMPGPRSFIETHTVGVAVRGINLRDLRRVPIALPPAHEANEIADRLGAATDRSRAEDVKLAKLHLLKQGLMDDLLTGRVRVTELLQETAQ